jgi:hypothetical protein
LAERLDDRSVERLADEIRGLNFIPDQRVRQAGFADRQVVVD